MCCGWFGEGIVRDWEFCSLARCAERAAILVSERAGRVVEGVVLRACGIRIARAVEVLGLLLG